MAKIILEPDEEFILESNGAVWLNRNRTHLQSMALTSKKIYLLLIRPDSLSGKLIKQVVAFPLKDILVNDGQIMVSQVKNVHVGTYLQIEMPQGTEKFAFEDSPTQTSAKWTAELYRLFPGRNEKKLKGMNIFKGLESSFNQMASSIAGITGITVEPITESEPIGQTSYQSDYSEYTFDYSEDMYSTDQEESVYENDIINDQEFDFDSDSNPSPSQSSASESVRFCMNCGAKNRMKAKFCRECGAKMSGLADTEPFPENTTDSGEDTAPEVSQASYDFNQDKADTPTEFRQKFAGAVLKCANCGADISPDYSVCPYCGTPVNGTAGKTRKSETSYKAKDKNPDSEIKRNTDFTRNPETRRQEYAGFILKCPSCGAEISQTTAVCPACGHHIIGQAAVYSVQAFSRQLMNLEVNRKAPGIGQMFGLAADPVDLQKLSLIRSFPIPNTVADIQEFMMLAIANIDDSLSKNTYKNRINSNTKSMETSYTMPRTISDAWVAKMEQAYQKASLSFRDDPAYENIRKLYVDKMEELELPIDD